MTGAVVGLLTLGWAYAMVRYWRADKQRRDLLTDMCQLAHDGKIDRDDLRRSRDIDELERRFDD